MSNLILHNKKARANHSSDLNISAKFWFICAIKFLSWYLPQITNESEIKTGKKERKKERQD